MLAPPARIGVLSTYDALEIFLWMGSRKITIDCSCPRKRKENKLEKKTDLAAFSPNLFREETTVQQLGKTAA